MTDGNDLERLVRQAAEIAKAAPAHLQEAAFNKAFDALSGNAAHVAAAPKPQGGLAPKQAAKTGRLRRRTPPGPAVSGERSHISEQLGRLDRTKYADVMSSADKVLPRALWVLRAAHDELSIDGLTVTEIVSVLKEKFRISVKWNAVQMALTRAGRYVDLQVEPGGTVYRIMAAGEEYLDRTE